MKRKHAVFYKLTASFLLVIARYAQSAKNSKFVISLQYIKKEGRDDAIYLGGHVQACPNYSKC